MGQLELVVTRAELDHCKETGNKSERQITLRSPSADIADIIKGLNRNNRVTLVLGSCVSLVVGDTSAIWRAHNEEYSEDFDILFNLLARRPDREMRFLCELA